jgi:hypothetical protein
LDFNVFCMLLAGLIQTTFQFIGTTQRTHVFDENDHSMTYDEYIERVKRKRQEKDESRVVVNYHQLFSIGKFSGHFTVSLFTWFDLICLRINLSSALAAHTLTFLRFSLDCMHDFHK